MNSSINRPVHKFVLVFSFIILTSFLVFQNSWLDLKKFKKSCQTENGKKIKTNSRIGRFLLLLTNPWKQAESSSWGGWAWNVGTTVGTALLPIYWEDDEDDDQELGDENIQSSKAFEMWRDKTTHMGFYVDEASFVFKLTERLPKSWNLAIQIDSFFHHYFE